MVNPQKGVLIAFGELFLKSDGVKEIFKGKLIQNLSLTLKGSDFRLYSFRERIFIETPEVRKVSNKVKNVLGFPGWPNL